MKVLYIHQYFATPDSNGGTRSYEFAKRLLARGHEVTFITSSAFVPSTWNLKKGWNKIEIDGVEIRVLHLPYSNKTNFLKRVAIFFQFAIRSLSMAKSLNCDMIFATSTPLTIAIPAVFAARKHKVPMVFEVRDLWPELPIAVGAIKSRLAKFLACKLELWAYRNSSKIIALSTGMADGVKKTGYPIEHISIIPNSCDNRLFSCDSYDIAAFRNSFSWLLGRPLVVYTGTLGMINGVSYLAELAAEVAKLNNEIRFAVFGEGMEEDLVRERAIALDVYEKNFFMLKAQPKKTMPVVLGAADVATSLFMPLEPMWNNSANKFFDALASSTPVAINYLGWQAEILSESKAGLVLSPNDIAKAARDLVAFLENRTLQKNSSNAAKKLALEVYDRDLLADKFCNVLESTRGSI